jgi:hypothetical protein
VTADAALLDLLMQLGNLGCEPVRHGSLFMGIRGPEVGRLPAGVWELLDQHDEMLARMLTRRPTPYQARRRHK